MSEPGQLIRSLSGRQSARNFHSFVINEIGHGVAAGQFAVGSILPNDAELMERFEVSRTVLREALKTLEAKGMVEARAKVGTRVQPRSRWSLFDRQVLQWIFHAPAEPGFVEQMLEVRRSMEMQAAPLAAQRRSSEQIRMMRYWLNQHDLGASMAQSAGLAAYEMHRLVLEASHNALLRSANAVPEFAIACALRADLLAGVQDFAAPRAGDYAALLGCIEHGAAPGAAEVMDRILAADEARLRPPAR